jgi:putative ABC transport system permease protein
MVMEIGQLRELLAREGDVTEFTVATEKRDRKSLERLGAEIQSLAPGLAALPADEYVDSAIEVQMARAVAWLTSTLALVIGTFGMVNTMFTSVFERTRELAILRAVGWSKRTVMKMILLEALFLGLSGAAAGTLAAVGLTQLLSRLPVTGRLVSGDIGLGVVSLALAMAVFLSIVGGWYPASRAAKIDPVEGFQQP